MSDIRIAEVRLRVESEQEAKAVIKAMQDAHGTARVALRAHVGRREGNIQPWFVRGTLQFELAQVGPPVPDTAAPAWFDEGQRTRPAATGPTTKLSETSRTKRLRKRA